jgi:protein-L-isoaspartate(D-aspartate) O-methyltransferase
MIDFKSARQTMVDTQLRPSRVNDPRVLAAFQSVPREHFLPATVRPLAYMDGYLEVEASIDAAPARFLLPPVTLALLVQLGEIEAADRVLDVGCMTGYSSAILSRLAAHVVALETNPALLALARKNLEALGIKNIAFADGELAEGALEQGPYDVILLNGSVPEAPESLLSQLKEGGRLVGVIATPSRGQVVQGKAYRYVMVDGEASGLPHFDANAKPLPGFAAVPSFVF